MPPQPRGREVDPLLAPFARDLDDAEWERLLGPLVMEHIQPVVTGVVRRRLGVAWRPDAEWNQSGSGEVGADILIRVLTRLRAMKGGEHPIADLRAYVAVTAFHACDDYLRHKYPRRARLKNRLRYALNHGAGLALWPDASGGWLAGLAGWKEQPPAANATRLQRLIEDPREFVAASLRSADPRRADVLTFLSELLGAVGQPIELDALVGVMAELWDVRDAGGLIDSDPQNAIEEAADPRPGAAAEAERRIYLERLWFEIRALPVRQRAALLLNLKDQRGCGVLSLLPLTGVATLRELAEALEMAAPDFAELWKELPLDDAAIAGRLGLARQQVINLRKSARERLARRMKKEGF